jgi:hypothetical protein
MDALGIESTLPVSDPQDHIAVALAWAAKSPEAVDDARLICGQNPTPSGGQTQGRQVEDTMSDLVALARQYVALSDQLEAVRGEIKLAVLNAGGGGDGARPMPAGRPIRTPSWGRQFNNN